MILEDQHERVRLKTQAIEKSKAAREGAACLRRAVEERLTDLQANCRSGAHAAADVLPAPTVSSFQGQAEPKRTSPR
jgi:hypothetical protein